MSEEKKYEKISYDYFMGFWSKIDKNGEICFLSDLKSSDPDACEKYNGAAIYIYRNSETGCNYIGQVDDQTIMERHTQHFRYVKTDDADSKKVKEDADFKRFKENKFDEIVVIRTSLAKRSGVISYIENQLIQFFYAEDADKNKNRNKGHQKGGFDDYKDVDGCVLFPLWNKYLNEKRGWVKTDLRELKKSLLFKFSPFKNLTDEQEKILNTIINNKDQNYVVQGVAGTGKTVILTNLIAKILDKIEQGELPKETTIGVVFDGNWQGYAEKIFIPYANLGYQNKTLTIGTSVQILNSNKHFNYLIVDESHKLPRRKSGKQNFVDNVFKNPAYKDYHSHLEALQSIGDMVVLMYDVYQAVRPSNISRDKYKELTKDYEYLFLQQQMRIERFEKKPYSPDDYINGIKYLLFKDTGLLELDKTFNKDFNKDVFREKSDNAYFSFNEGDNPLEDAFRFVNEDRSCSDGRHENRVLAGMIMDDTEESRASGKYVLKYNTNRDSKEKDEKGYCKIKHWNEGTIQKPWNAGYKSWLLRNDPDNFDQIGCMYAVQGIDLDCAAVIIGNDLKVKDGKLCVDESKVNNNNLKFKKKEREKMQDEFNILILGQYFVLLTRASYRVRVEFWKNKEFLEYMKKTLEIE